MQEGRKSFTLCEENIKSHDPTLLNRIPIREDARLRYLRPVLNALGQRALRVAGEWLRGPILSVIARRK